MIDELRAAVVGVGALRQQHRVGRRGGAAFVRLVSRGAAGNALVQGLLAEQIAIAQSGAREHPMRIAFHAIRRSRHQACRGAHDAQQVRFRFERAMHAALICHRSIVRMAAHLAAKAVHMAAAAHSTVTAQSHFAVQPVAGQIHEAPSAFENPALQGKVHLACPIFGMNRQYQHTVGIQIQRTVVQLGFGVIIVSETLPLQPA